MNELLKELYSDNQGALCNFPMPPVVRGWVEEEAKKRGYDNWGEFYEDIIEKNKDTYPGGSLAVEAEYAKAKKFPVEDYWKARLAGAGNIRTALDIARAINE